MRKTCTSRASTKGTQLYVYLSCALHQTAFTPIETPHVDHSLYIILYPTDLPSFLLSRLLSSSLVSPSLFSLSLFRLRRFPPSPEAPSFSRRPDRLETNPLGSRGTPSREGRIDRDASSNLGLNPKILWYGYDFGRWEYFCGCDPRSTFFLLEFVSEALLFILSRNSSSDAMCCSGLMCERWVSCVHLFFLWLICD